MKKRKTIYIALALLVILIIAALAAKKMGLINKKEGYEVAVEKVKKTNITEVVSANGKIEPETEIKITPYISGEVVELGVIEGAYVKKGDFLAKIDPEIYKSNFERIEANLNSQKANNANANARLTQVKAQFLKAKKDYDRNLKLYNQEVISEAEIEGFKSRYDVAKADVDAATENVKATQYAIKSAQASLNEARENLVRTSIYAPSDGTISRLNVEVGERVTGASQFSAGTELMRIANLKKMEVNVSVNENDIIRIHLQDTAIIEVDAYFNRKFKGIVTEIATSAKDNSRLADQVTNFDVKVSILPESYADIVHKEVNQSPFRPGMSAGVDIQTNTQYNVPSVLIQAVVAKTDTASSTDKLKEYVFVEENGLAIKKLVETGIQDNEFIQIKKGLDGNENVIIAPYRTITKKLKDSTKVKVVDKEKF